MGAQAPSERTEVRRLAERGVYDADTINAIVDEALICHVGFVDDDGSPVVIPTIHARARDVLYLHGSAASKMLRSVKRGGQVCITITLIDGIVLARSLFHHSMNYRSVVIFGAAREVTDLEEKQLAFRAVTDHIVVGRWDDARQPTDKENRATTIVAIPLDEASAKVRSGPPCDDDEDYALRVWAGVLPLSLVAGAPVADPVLPEDIAEPDYLRGYHRPGA